MLITTMKTNVMIIWRRPRCHNRLSVAIGGLGRGGLGVLTR